MRSVGNFYATQRCILFYVDLWTPAVVIIKKEKLWHNQEFQKFYSLKIFSIKEKACRNKTMKKNYLIKMCMEYEWISF